jgi:hypothetical protein
VFTLARLVFAALPLVGGAYLMYAALDDLSRSREAAAWPSVQGEVLRNDRSGLIGYYGGTVFEYSYRVNEVTHASGRYGFGPFVLDGGGSLRQGSPLTVHYDPSNHAEAVVQTGANLGHLIQAAVGLALVIVGAVIWKQTA